MNKETQAKLLQAVKIGIIKQLHKDGLLTTQQYHYLLKKYGYNG